MPYFDGKTKSDWEPYCSLAQSLFYYFGDMIANGDDNGTIINNTR